MSAAGRDTSAMNLARQEKYPLMEQSQAGSYRWRLYIGDLRSRGVELSAMANLGSWLADNPGYHGKYLTMMLMLKTDFKTACKNNSRTSFPGDYSIDDDPELNE